MCQFLVLAIMTRKKKSYSRLSGGLCCCVSFWFWREIDSFFVVAGKLDYDRKKKSYSCLSGRLCCCVSFWFWREIGSFFVVAGNFYYDRKKRYSHLSGGCAIIITTGKKKIQLSVWRVVLLCQFLVLAGNRFWLYILLCTWSTIQLWCCVSFFGSGGK